MHHRNVQGPADTLATDLIGLLPHSTAGYTWLSVCQDTFTRWVDLRPIYKATAVAISQHITDVIYRHGCPKQIITDNEKQYRSQEFGDLLRRMGIRHQPTPPYSPQCNPVERANRTVKTMIAQYVKGNHRKWDVHLNELAFAVNTAI